MPSNQLNSGEFTAKAKFDLANINPAQIVETTTQVAAVLKQHPDYGTKPDIQKGVDEWVAAADVVSKDAQALTAARLELAARVLTRDKDLAEWKRATKKLVATVDKESAGSAEAIKQWGFGVAERVTPPLSTEPPTGLRAVVRKDFSLLLRWDAVPANLGYVVQMGDGAENWGPGVDCAQARFAPQGLTPGQKVAFRVAVRRRSGLSSWSPALVLTVR